MSAKTIIVTGASRGIGYAVAKYLLTCTPRNNVVLLARTEDSMRALKESHPDQVEYIAGDISDHSLGEKAVKLAVSKFGRLDGLVLNHGTLGQVAFIANADIEQWKSGFDVNFFSLVSFTKAALPALRESKGRIIFTSSGAAVSGYHSWGLYGATKAAMNHLALTLSTEEPDVTSVSVRPGMVDTEMQREIREEHQTNMPPEAYKKFDEAHKNAKLLKPEVPGHIIARLVLDAPKKLSGRFINWNDEELAVFRN